MKIKFPILLFISACIVFSSCSEDNEVVKEYFKADYVPFEVNLKTANIYKSSESPVVYLNSISFNYRVYYITDGIKIEGEQGWNLEDYTNATYVIAVELAWPFDEDYTDGEYSTNIPWSTPQSTDRLAYISINIPDNAYFDMDYEFELPDLIVNGGDDIDDNISFSFDGNLVYRQWTNGKLSVYKNGIASLFITDKIK